MLAFSEYTLPIVKRPCFSRKNDGVLPSSRVHPTLGILARFQAFFYASAFFQLDGVPPPAPARVTQTVGRPYESTPRIGSSELGGPFMAVLAATDGGWPLAVFPAEREGRLDFLF